MKKWCFGLLLLVLTAPSLAQTPVLATCPFQVAELNARFADAFATGLVGSTYTSAGMTMRGCRYATKSYTLVVNTTLLAQPMTTQQWMPGKAGSIVAVPRDPDGAVLQINQGDLTSPTLHYVRQKVAVELRILGIYYKGLKPTNTEFKAMQDKLIALRRVP